MFYGEEQDKMVVRTCVALSYDSDGDPKRTPGVYYPDLGYIWEDSFNRKNESKGKKY